METIQKMSKRQEERIEKQKDERKFYEKNKWLIEKFLKGHLPITIIVNTGNIYKKLDYKKMFRLAEKFDKDLYTKILEHDKSLTDFYDNNLDIIIPVLTCDAQTLLEDRNTFNQILYQLNYYDLVGFSPEEFYKIVKWKYPESTLAKLLERDHRNISYLSTEKFIFSEYSLDTKGDLVLFDEDMPLFTFINEKKITREDYKYCIELLQANQIPPLVNIVENAIRAYAYDEFDDFITKINERRYINKINNQVEHKSRGKTLVKKPVLNNKNYVEK